MTEDPASRLRRMEEHYRDRETWQLRDDLQSTLAEARNPRLPVARRREAEEDARALGTLLRRRRGTS